jgi:hypothetical protein
VIKAPRIVAGLFAGGCERSRAALPLLATAVVDRFEHRRYLIEIPLRASERALKRVTEKSQRH